MSKYLLEIGIVFRRYGIDRKKLLKILILLILSNVLFYLLIDFSNVESITPVEKTFPKEYAEIEIVGERRTPDKPGMAIGIWNTSGHLIVEKAFYVSTSVNANDPAGVLKINVAIPRATISQMAIPQQYIILPFHPYEKSPRRGDTHDDSF